MGFFQALTAHARKRWDCTSDTFCLLALEQTGSLICQYASKWVDSQSERKKKILLRLSYYNDFDKCTADKKTILIPGDRSMLDSLLSHCADCAYVTSSWMTGPESRHTVHASFRIVCLVIINILLLVANNLAIVFRNFGFPFKSHKGRGFSLLKHICCIFWNTYVTSFFCKGLSKIPSHTCTPPPFLYGSKYY